MEYVGPAALNAFDAVGSIIERVDKKEWKALHTSRLLLPRANNAVYLDYNNCFTVSPFVAGRRVRLSYVPVLPRINWTYVVINQAPMFNPIPSTTQNCELHVSEENVLIYKILRLAGIAIQKQDIAQAGQMMEMASQAKRLNK